MAGTKQSGKEDTWHRGFICPTPIPHLPPASGGRPERHTLTLAPPTFGLRVARAEGDSASQLTPPPTEIINSSDNVLICV
jgi:hypothetical protein